MLKLAVPASFATLEENVGVVIGRICKLAVLVSFAALEANVGTPVVMALDPSEPPPSSSY